jgi:2-oxoglutarate ferredoxin oxidoreductase subunit alpha
MTPVIVLSDAFTANGAEPWRVPEIDDLAPIPVRHPAARDDGAPFLPYTRDELLARPWAIPGTPGLEHRIGGLEKSDGTGFVSYDPANHQHMVELRAQKVMNAQTMIPPLEAEGPETGDLLVLTWGGTMGACRRATLRAQAKGLSVAHAHLRHLHPMPANTAELIARYRQVLVPELNMGQLATLISARFAAKVTELHKVQGRPFTAAEVFSAIEALVGEGETA